MRRWWSAWTKMWVVWWGPSTSWAYKRILWFFFLRTMAGYANFPSRTPGVQARGPTTKGAFACPWPFAGLGWWNPVRPVRCRWRGLIFIRHLWKQWEPIQVRVRKWMEIAWYLSWAERGNSLKTGLFTGIFRFICKIMPGRRTSPAMPSFVPVRALC